MEVVKRFCAAVVMAAVCGLGCAQGAESDSKAGAGPSQVGQSIVVPDAGGMAGASSPPVEVDAGVPMDDREPCAQGEAMACACPGTDAQGMRLCIYDTASPLGGFLGACDGCPPPAAQTSCDDGALGDAETDIDCGGPDCPPCALDRGCMGDGDCADGVCEAGMCKEAPPPAAGTGSAAGTGGTGGTGGAAGMAGTGGTGGAPPPPPPPPSTDCTMDPSVCSGLLDCCKSDGTCGTGLDILCL